jgi:hypothetical protein
MISSSLFLINKGHTSNAEKITIWKVSKYLDEFNEKNSPQSSKVANDSTIPNKSSIKFPNYGEVRKSLIAKHGKLSDRDRLIMSSTRDIIVGN